MRDFDQTHLGMNIGEAPTLLEVDWTPRSSVRRRDFIP